MSQQSEPSQRCPFINKPTEEKPIIEPPEHSGFGVVNIYRYMKYGHPLFEEVSNDLDAKVFGMTFDCKHYLVTDHIGIKACYEDEKFDKEPSFGIIKVNTDATRGSMPLVTGEAHRIGKGQIMTYMEHVYSNFDCEQLIQDVANCFENFKGWNNISNEKARSIDFEGLMSDMFAKVITKFMFGESIERNLIEEWIPRSIKFCYGFRFSKSSKDKQVADALYGAIEGTPYFQKLSEILPSLEAEEKEECCNTIIYGLMFAGFAGPRLFFLSSLICLYKLNDLEKQNLKEECESFMKNENRNFDDLENLPLLHTFFMETARLHPSAPQIWRRPKENMVIESAHNRYEIPKGSLVCGKACISNRDPLLYEDSKEFSMNRDVDTLENNTYSWGGLYRTKPTPDNYMCPGVKLSTAVVKVFIIYFLRCNMKATDDVTYSGGNVKRSVASDQPVKMKTFEYQP